MRRRFPVRKTRLAVFIWSMLGLVGFVTTPAVADPFSFSTGNPDGKIGTLSRQVSLGKLETETADDFILTQTTSINHATFTGLLPSGTPLTNVTNAY